MSEVQIFTDINSVRWMLAGLVSVITALIIYIWRSMKKNIDRICEKQEKDHDRLDIIETKIDIYHPNKSD